MKFPAGPHETGMANLYTSWIIVLLEGRWSDQVLRLRVGIAGAYVKMG